MPDPSTAQRVTLDAPVNILVIEGLTMPEAKPEFLADIAAAAPAGSTINVVGGVKDAFEHAADVEVILGILSKSLFAQTPHLKWIHAIASGVDMFMFDEFINSPVVLTGEKGLVGGHLADTGFGLLLALTRQIHTAIKLGPDGWAKREAMRAKEIELEGLTMGVLGYGGTGRAMAKRAVAFGMNTIAVDEFPTGDAWGMDRLDDLLGQSDVVAICCPLTDDTSKMFNHELFAKMKDGSYLVNVTRGEIMDDESLVAALTSGKLAGAALDVAPGEPLAADHALFGLDNVAMTPHTAGASQLRAPKNVARFCENLRRSQTGQDFEGVVSKQLGF